MCYVVSTAVFAIWNFLLWFGTGILARIHISPVLEAVILLGFWPDCILTIGLWTKYLDAVFYLRRLKKYGYEIPRDKQVYHQNLKLLPQMENTGQTPSGINYGSIVLTVVTGMVAAGLIAYDIWFWVQYSFVGTDIRLFEGILCSGTLLWLLYMVSYAMQISSKKYKNDVEIDADRKDRKSLISGLANISGLLALTIFTVWVIKSFVVILINVRFRDM